MAMMFHGLDILRVNLYIVYKNKTADDPPRDHKSFLVEYISALLNRAIFQIYCRTWSSSPVVPKTSPPGKHYRMSSKKCPTLPTKRLDKPRELHVATTAPGNKQRECTYCRYLKAKQLFVDKKVTIKPREPSRICHYCKEHLCREHFDVYHSHNA